MKVGIIGLPGSGKTTVFQLITEHFGPPDYRAGNKPQLRRVNVRDPRLERLRDDYQPKKYTPAAVDVLDFPAVQKEGQDRSGLADLLAPAREAHALIVVLRAFANPAVPGGDQIDPAAELAEVRGELILTDLVIVEKRIEKLEEKARKPRFSDEEKKELEVQKRVHAHLEAERGLSTFEFTAAASKLLSGFGFLSAKPFVTVINTDGTNDGAIGSDESLASLRALEAEEILVIPARNEADVLELPEEERADFLEEYGIETFHRDELIAAAYRAAGARSFFTTGEDEVRAWTIKAGTPAPEAAGEIHTDIERGFIRAEVVAYDDYVANGGTKGAKEAGVYRLEGKEYEVKDGDVIEFRFSV